ncbi:hypothetical protein KRX52_10505 [Pseudomonas sp. MAP12]|uniref:Uncharacterized protein n=1 Tax=Geopseudomonas aromaticivorans TaxID=2849492 RepID=A0ABS6MWP5_9GAMM|nr:hypothetical protein [Pseudomonas aromaticivorans]MBV2133228.1 hypothetical protein [Pseudomonas aromaticivorans]
MPAHPPKSPFAWLGDLSKLHQRDQLMLLQVGAMLAVAGMLLACVLTLFLAALAIKGVAWWQLRESPWVGMDDRDFTRCVDLAGELREAAHDVRRSEQGHLAIGDSAQREYQNLTEVFYVACGEERWSAVFAANGQPPLGHPADWLPFAGQARDSWPSGVGWPEL